MPTRLERGKKLSREVPSNSHDARNTGAMIVTITRVNDLAEIEIRPKGKRSGVTVTVDGAYSMLTKRQVAADFTRRKL